MNKFMQSFFLWQLLFALIGPQRVFSTSCNAVLDTADEGDMNSPLQKIVVNTEGKLTTLQGNPIPFFFDIDATTYLIVRRDEEKPVSGPIVEIENNGQTDQYEYYRDISQLILDLQRLGFVVSFLSVNTSERNTTLLKKTPFEETSKSVYEQVEGRVFNGESVYYNYNPTNFRAPELLKVVPRSLITQIIGEGPSSQDRSPEAHHYRQTKRALTANSVFLDDVAGTAKNLIHIPSIKEGGPSPQWPHRRAYVLGVLVEALRFASLKQTSLGQALRTIQEKFGPASPNQWKQKVDYFVPKGANFIHGGFDLSFIPIESHD